MGKTYINYWGTQRCLRQCSGWRQATRNNCRPGAIPPDGWGREVPTSRNTWMPHQIIKNMREQGYPMYETIKRIQKKYKFSYLQAHELCDSTYNAHLRYSWMRTVKEEKFVPDNTLFIWKKKRINEKRY